MILQKSSAGRMEDKDWIRNEYISRIVELAIIEDKI